MWFNDSSYCNHTVVEQGEERWCKYRVTSHEYGGYCTWHKYEYYPYKLKVELMMKGQSEADATKAVAKWEEDWRADIFARARASAKADREAEAEAERAADARAEARAAAKAAEAERVAKAERAAEAERVAKAAKVAEAIRIAAEEEAARRAAVVTALRTYVEGPSTEPSKEAFLGKMARLIALPFAERSSATVALSEDYRIVERDVEGERS